jgi:PKD repeat protein
VTLDGTGSTGNAPITCTWTFENRSGSTLWEPPVNGCPLQKTFRVPGTKYVRLTVTDADGDTDANKQSFTVRAP